jgi:Xaa-Pro aminopeptidase
VIQPGDLLCLDTDAIGYQGFAVDYSRTFLCHGRPPSAAQCQLFALAFSQLQHNSDLLQCGRSFEEIACKAWPIPAAHRQSRYYAIDHGLGMSGDFPNIPHANPCERYPLHGVLEAGMVVCIESYIGSSKHQQGVKLENQYLITESGTELMSRHELPEQLRAAKLEAAHAAATTGEQALRWSTQRNEVPTGSAAIHAIA